MAVAGAPPPRTRSTAASHRPADAVRRTMGYRPDVGRPGDRVPGRGPARRRPGRRPAGTGLGGRRRRRRVPADPRGPGRRGADRDRADGPVRAVSAPSVDRGAGRVGRRTSRAGRHGAAGADGLVLLVPLLHGGHRGRRRWRTSTRSARLDLPVDVVQIDDGWQAEIGDWLELSGRFASLARPGRAASATPAAGAGIWLAPFLAAARAARGPRAPGLVPGEPPAPASTGTSELYGLDPTQPGRRGLPAGGVRRLRALGFDYFKIDFLYAGALDGRRHDGSDRSRPTGRAGLIRDAIGPDAYLLGCGAPILPSVGLVDAMRVSADIAPHYEPPDGDPCQPSQLGADAVHGGPGAGSTAGSGSTTRTASSPARRCSGGRSGPRWWSGTAGCARRRTASPPSTTGAWRPPAGCSRTRAAAHALRLTPVQGGAPYLTLTVQ